MLFARQQPTMAIADPVDPALLQRADQVIE
jgi:hypothetical protein